MSRAVSATFKSALFARETDKVFVVLVDIMYDSTHFRISSNSEDIVSGGETFFAYPFKISLPDDTDRGISQGQITIDNIHRDIVAGIRAATSPPSVTIQIVLSDTPSTIEVEFADFKFINVQYDALTIRGDLSIESFLGEPFPAESFSPSFFPGLF